MPHINRIRVNNVKYNFGTQSYDDFMLKPFGKNTLYDLANGGGKSVLMLLMLQTILPNCTLDEKQPIEKLFRTGDGSNTIHSLIEWKLDEKDRQEGFSYMTTGFCAKKAGGSVTADALVQNTASIEYFNYCIFYRDYNENDIRNLPLVKDKERITYAGLRKYLLDLKRDNSLVVKVFDRKGEYQSFISKYGLYESEWEIIRGINKTEGHVRTYFESRYKTTRKVVEDLLIEEIIQKSFLLKSGVEATQEHMSKTLLEIKEKLLQLSKKKNEIKNFDYQIELLSNFSNRLANLKDMYEEKDITVEQIKRAYENILQTLKEQVKVKNAKSMKVQEVKEEKIALARQMDSIKYAFDNKEAKEIQKQRDKVKEELILLTDEKEKRIKNLSFMESGNDYIEYLEEKQKKEEIFEAIAAVDDKNSGLIDEIRELVSCLEYRIQIKKEILEAQLQGSLCVYESLQKEEIQFDQKERLLEKEAYVYEEKLSEIEAQIKSQQMKIECLKQDAGILVIEEINQLRKEVIEKQDEYKKKIQSEVGKLNEWEQQIKKCQEKQREVELHMEQLERVHKEEEAFFKEYEIVEEQIEQLCKAYGVPHAKGLQIEIQNRYKANIKRVGKIKNESLNIEQSKQNLEKGFVLSSESDFVKLLDKIREKYSGVCFSGFEYMKELDDEKRKEALLQYPYLPFSIIVAEDGYEQVAKEVLSSENEFCTGIVPVVNLSLLKKGEYLFSNTHMVLAAKNIEVYFDAVKIEMEKKRIALQIEEMQTELLRLRDKEQTYLTDDKFVHTFLIKYMQEYPMKLEKRELRKKQIQECIKIKEEQKKRLDSLIEAKNASKILKNQFEEQCQVAFKDGVILEQLWIQKGELEIQDNLKKEWQEKLKVRIKELAITKEKRKETLESLEKLNIQVRGQQEKIKELETTWNEKYANYYVERKFCELNETTEELLAKVNGKIIAYESKHTDLEDKKRLIESYTNNINRLLKSVLNGGMSESDYESLYKENKLYVTSDKTLSKEREEVRTLEESISQKNQILGKLTAQWNRLDGKISNTKEAIKSTYGFIDQIEVENQSMESLLFEYQQKRGHCEVILKNYEEEERTLENEILVFEDIKKDIERMFKSIGYLESGVFCKEEHPVDKEELKTVFLELEQKFERVETALKEKQAEFYKYKQKLTEALLLVNATGLAQEISTSVRMPESMQEAVQLRDNIIEVSKLLELEKARIERGITDIQSIKSNFVNQCLQQCMNIKTELEKLSKYSKIMLDGELIPIITLTIPYVKEELYIEKMSSYIEETVLGVDDYANANDKLKYIRNALSLKKLFSVIVTDMNQIKLSLYKRERMKINSRHLRYEEAVGSTGQSQGIYIQFLIAIINYISNLNSGNCENKGLRKVIFIDNPFGAAKDVYIWEPIFELLKTNEVQLIVPARGTTPAITGRFDVNYVLGQKLVEGKQQTVVVDFESKVDVQEIEYIPLEFEQTSLNLYD